MANPDGLRHLRAEKAEVVGSWGGWSLRKAKSHPSFSHHPTSTATTTAAPHNCSKRDNLGVPETWRRMGELGSLTLTERGR
jgi:hypothetical protein